MDMGTVNHQDVIFQVLAQSGMRAVAGKTMMDFGDRPEGLQESTRDSLDQSLKLLQKWNNFDDGRLKYAFAPRFVLSCTDDLLQETGRLARENQVLYHTHAAENKKETELVQERFGTSNIQAFEKLGVADENLCLAHCVWTDKRDRDLMTERNIKVLHCPSANLKLGSGIAPIPDYLARGINVSLGADGAPCNNNLNIFQEMRLAALIQKPLHGPKAMPAEQVIKMATIEGAKTLQLDNEIGSLEAGKRADLTFIKINQVHSIPFDNIYSKLVYSSTASDVKHVMVQGKWVLNDRQLLTIDENATLNAIQKRMNYQKTGV
jgi:cytosine/adenosine deaminase-related metal-dependent hydrolase